MKLLTRQYSTVIYPILSYPIRHYHWFWDTWKLIFTFIYNCHPEFSSGSAWRKVLRLHSRLSYSASLYKRNISYCQLTPTTVLDFLHAQIVSPSVRCTSRLNIFAIRTSSVRKSAWTCAKNKFILINKFGTGNKCMGSPLSKMILNHFFGRVQNARLGVIRTPLHFYKRSRLRHLVIQNNATFL